MKPSSQFKTCWFHNLLEWAPIKGQDTPRPSNIPRETGRPPLLSCSPCSSYCLRSGGVGVGRKPLLEAISLK